MNFDNIKVLIETLFNFSIVGEDDDKVTYNIIPGKTAILSKSQINQIIENLNTLEVDNQIELFDNNHYEVIVRNEQFFRIEREISQIDSVNNIEYKIGKPSYRYLIFFLINLGKQNTLRIFGDRIFPHRLRRLLAIDNEDEGCLSDKNVLDVITSLVPRLDTLQIKSENSSKKSEFEQLMYSFLFNLSYNLDYTILPMRFIDEFTQPYRMGSLRKANISEIEPPKRRYSNELILYYQKGVSSESIDHQFLSFYHILEHFFEKIYNDEIIHSIKNELTKPSFSYKRNKDLAGLITLIQSRLKYKNEELLLNELRALELTLIKFVEDLPNLKSELKVISPKLIDYFKTTIVPFSNGNKVNFESSNSNEIYSNLAKRIYYTRNSIVHSKETDKSKYTPFRDDKDLLKEIYLLRLVAEIVIFGDSKEL
jgi:hypothetical protein